MTRDELIEKVARRMKPRATNLVDKLITMGASHSDAIELLPLDEAEAAINTIFDALKEPTDDMCFAGGEYVLSVGSIDCMHVDDRPEFGMKGRETGSYELFQAMLSASPLAPEQ